MSLNNRNLQTSREKDFQVNHVNNFGGFQVLI